MGDVCSEETVDELRGFGLRVVQPALATGFPWTAPFVRFRAIRRGGRVDLEGFGVIPIILARLARVAGERSRTREDMADLATRQRGNERTSGRGPALGCSAC